MSREKSTVLENCVWESLVGKHKHLAIENGTACRYHPDVSPFAALKKNDRQSLKALAKIVAPGELVLLRDEVPEHDGEWQIEKSTTTLQMVLPSTAPVELQVDVRQLRESNVPAMLELTALTLPGYLRRRSIEMGSYFGIFSGNKLVSMAGERIFPSPFREITAVCTNPEYRGRGYASVLVEHVAARMRTDGHTPFLHLRESNVPALRVYRRLGFVDNGLSITSGIRLMERNHS